METFEGKVWLLGDDIDTDIIIPTEYLALKTVQDMAPYAFSPLRPELAGQITPGDIIVAGKNFGCGSSREQAVKCLKARGIAAIIADGFARSFYRNALNQGLLTITCEHACSRIRPDSSVRIDTENSLLIVDGEPVPFPEYPPYVRKLVDAGGLIPYTRQRLRDRH